jgi:hypothetical protein
MGRIVAGRGEKARNNRREKGERRNDEFFRLH